MRALFTAFAVLSLAAACGGTNGDDSDGGDSDGGDDDTPCVGLECQVVNCAKDQKPETTISGTIFAPNGTLPLHGVSVYVPREASLPPFVEGAQCSRCIDELPGVPIVRTESNDAGRFVLEKVPSGDNIPLVITTGKWRRQITIPRVESCTETSLGMADTRLPRTKAEGDIPKIALTTGNADSLECLVRKLGIDDTEVTTSGGAGRVHFYDGNGIDAFSGGGNFANATTLWGTVDTLKQYDIVFLSCEGGQNPGTKPQATLDAMKAYADLGGRVFASHWHNIWIGGNFLGGGSPRPQVWTSVATWRNNDQNGNPGNPIVIDENNNPKGPAFAQWMVNVKGTGTQAETGVGPNTTRGQIALEGSTGRVSALTLDQTRAERWVYSTAAQSPQMFQFTTPNEMPIESRCGKVVFTDMHVSGSPGSGGYPNACPETTLTPQEKALAFMFFDIASCVGGVF